MKKAGWSMKANGFKTYAEYKSLLLGIRDAAELEELRQTWEYFMKPEGKPVRFCAECKEHGVERVAEWQLKRKVLHYVCNAHRQKYLDNEEYCKPDFKYLYSYSRQVFREHMFDLDSNNDTKLQWMRIPSRKAGAQEEHAALSDKIMNIEQKVNKVSSYDDKKKLKGKIKELKSERKQYTQFAPVMVRLFMYIGWDEILLAVKEPRWNMWEEEEVKESLGKMDW